MQVYLYNIIGAGTILQSLRANKKMIVVINESLMNNHQIELGDICSLKHYLLSTTCNNLLNTIIKIPNEKFEKYPKKDTNAFHNFIMNEIY